MEIEFDVKVTASVLYDYMLYHTYTSASGLLGTMVGVLLLMGFMAYGKVIYLIAAIILIGYLPWTLYIKSKQQALSNPSFKQPLHYKLTEEGIGISQGEAAEMQSWDSMHKAVSTRRSIIIYTSPRKASIFPRSDLQDMTVQVIQMICTHMPPNKVKIRG